MKTILLILSLSLFTIANAQEENISNKKLGLTFTPVGENDIAQFDGLDGAGSSYGEGFFSIGLTYQNVVIANWLKFETGLEYSHQKIRTKPAPNPPIPSTPSYSNFSLLTIPLDFNAVILKYLFIEGGGIVDIYTGSNAKISNQNGIGLHLGYGLQYEFKSGWTFTINHYGRMHSLVPFSGDRYQQHVLQNGFRVGVYMPFSALLNKKN